MGNALLSSKIAIIEEQPKIRPITGVPISDTACVGVTQRGPFGPNLVQSFEQYERVYGSDTVNGDVCTAARGFFDQGGQNLWVGRTVHYTDITNANSKTSASASVELLTNVLSVSSGSELGTVNGPFVLHNADHLDLSIDGGGTVHAVFSGTSADSESTTGPYDLANGQTLLVAIDGGPVQTITFATAEFISIAAATALEVASAINGQIVGAAAIVVSGAVKIVSDTLGTGSKVNVSGGTSNAVLEFTTGTQSGTGNAVDLAAATTAEVIAVINAATGQTTASNVSGAIKLISQTTGGSSSVQVLSTSLVDGTTGSALGFDNASHTGAAGGAVDTLLVDGASDGAFGNSVQAQIAAASNGQADFFNLTVYEQGSVVESWPNVTMDATSPFYVVDVINDPVNGSTYIELTDLFASAPAPDNRPANGLFTLSGGSDGLSGIVDNDFVGDPTGGTGIRAFDQTPSVAILIVPGRATPVVHNAMITYCETVRFAEMFAILDSPAGYSAQEIQTYVTTTAAIYESSEFAAIYWPRVSVANPSQALYGAGTSITVPTSGLIAGVYARNDAASPGGVYEAPAGVAYGLLNNVLGLETNEVKDENKRDLIYPSLINPIVGLDGLPIHIDGCRTLYDQGNFPTIGERRGVIYIERSFRQALVFAKHRKIKSSTLSSLSRQANAFMIVQMNNDAFASNDATTAFYVDFGPGLNTALTAQAQQIIGRISIATAKPAEFIILRVGQDTRALEAQLTAAMTS